MLRYLKWPMILFAAWWLGWQSHAYWSSRSLLLPELSVPSTASRSPGHSIEKSYQNLPRPTELPLETHADSQSATELINTVLQQKLANHQYEGVVQLLTDADFNHHYETIRQSIIQHLRDLLANKDYAHAEQLFSRYLDVEYRDVEVLLMRATFYRAQQQFGLAIETLYKARSYEYRTAHLENLTTQIRALVTQFDKKLRRQNNNAERLALYEQLTTLEPDYSPYFVELARVHVTLGNVTQARQALSLVAHDPQVSQHVETLLNQIEYDVSITSSELATLPLTRRGEHFLVQAWINDHTAINLLIDTGASLTMIRSDVLQAAGVTRLAAHPLRRFNTANGVVHASVLVLDSLSMGQQRVNNLEVGSLNSENFRAADGLLGMNFLKHFKFFIDQGELVLRLTALP